MKVLDIRGQKVKIFKVFLEVLKEVWMLCLKYLVKPTIWKLFYFVYTKCFLMKRTQLRAAILTALLAYLTELAYLLVL